MTFVGYRHITLEIVPRTFYVGIGSLKRSSSLHRNHKWHAIVKRYGFRIEVLQQFELWSEACDWEIKTILELGTHTINHEHDNPNDIGCNFSLGGEGNPGITVSPETKQKMSLAKKNRAPNNKGKKATDIARANYRKGNIGKNKGRAPWNKGSHTGQIPWNKGKKLAKLIDSNDQILE